MSPGRRGRIASFILPLAGLAALFAAAPALAQVPVEIAPPAAGARTAPAEIVPPLVAPFTWQATRTASGHMQFRGYVPSTEVRRALLQASGPRTLDATVQARGAPADFARDAEAGLAVLALMDRGTLAYDGQVWRVSGTVIDPERGRAVRSALEKAEAESRNWVVSLALPDLPPEPVAEPEPEPAPVAPPQPSGKPAPPVPPAQPLSEPAPEPQPKSEPEAASPPEPEARPQPEPEIAPAPAVETPAAIPEPAPTPAPDPEPAPTPAPEPEPGAVSDEGIVAVCAARIAGHVAANPIAFTSGSAVLESASREVVRAVAVWLADCPTALVEIEGHTDSDGAEDANMALSVARAEAVVSVLIEAGVASERLYAIGYGEGLPVADNATAAGKRANRRIVFTLVPESGPGPRPAGQ